MSELAKLLDGVEVEWKSLGDVINLEKGKQLNKEFLSENGQYPAFNGGTSFSGFTDFHNYNENTIIISQGGASAGFVNFITTKFYANAHCYVILPNIKKVENRYIYHFLKLNQERLMTKQHGAGIPALRTIEILEIQIPIPCPDKPQKSLEIQKEIVRILDIFTERTETLINELTTELEARKKQYSYYREQLLNFEEGEVEWKTLQKLTSLITKGTTPKNYTNNGIAFIKTEAFDGTYINPNKLSFIDEETHKKELKRSILKHNDILITIAGATIGKCAIVPKGILPANTNQALAIIRLNPDVNLKYVFHLIKSNYLTKYIEQNIKGSAQPNLNLEQLNNFTIPYPLPIEQARIVVILDKLENLTISISEALPKEIELRKKQYEYYRDLLLTFPNDNIKA